MQILEKNLDKIKRQIVKNDLDWFIVIEGYERSGKSKLAKKIAQYFDPDFKIRQFVFTMPQLENLIYDKSHPLKKGQVVIIDEGATAMFKRDAMREENVDGVKTLTTMGHKNLLVIICVPSAFELIESYVMRHRIKTLIKIIRRGKFKAYNRKLIKRVHFNAKTRTWVYPRCAFAERFTAPDDELWAEYLEKKEEYLSTRSNMRKVEGWGGQGAAAKAAFRTKETIQRWRVNGLLPSAKQQGGRWAYRLDEVKEVAERYTNKNKRKQHRPRA